GSPAPPPAHRPAVPQARRRPGGPPGGPGLQPAPGGPPALDVDAARRPAGRAAGRGRHQPRVRAHDAEKNDPRPWRTQRWVLPREQNAGFVCAMEAVREAYQRPYDPKRPRVCRDGAGKQLAAETRTPVPAGPGQPARVDYEYERQGTANVFMACEPLAGQRHVRVTGRRTAVDFAETIRLLGDERDPDAGRKERKGVGEGT